MTGRVVVVGSANLDHLVTVVALPSPGATVSGEGYRTAAGGKGLNQAVTAARQGAPTVMIGALGDDPWGGELRRVLETEGIDHKGVVVAEGVPTGVALVTVATGGSNTIVVAAGANATVSPSQLAHFEWRIDDVALCQLEIPLATTAAALAGASAAGACTILNPAPLAAALPASLLALVDVLVPNEVEAAVLAGSHGGDDQVALCAALAAEHDLTVVVTLGAAGSIMLRPDGSTLPIAAHRVAAVDTTAAGDAYCGALAAALVNGEDLEAALRRASAAGSLATTAAGAVPSLPTAAAVDALLSS